MSDIADNIAAYIFVISLIIVHIIPLVLSIYIIKLLKKKKKNLFVGILLLILSLIPIILFVIIATHAMTCGSGCFSGIFLLISLIPSIFLIHICFIVLEYSSAKKKKSTPFWAELINNDIGIKKDKKTKENSETESEPEEMIRKRWEI